MQTGEQHPSRGRFLIGVFFALIVAFAGGVVYGQSSKGSVAASSVASFAPSSSVKGLGSAPPKDIQTPVDFEQFWELWHRLKEQYYEQPVSDSALFYGAMRGLASAVGDPYTVYFDPKSAKEFAEDLQGKFEGLVADAGDRWKLAE
jgi:carboxyl-terminal processing protease